jgi:hypothetical protein
MNEPVFDLPTALHQDSTGTARAHFLRTDVFRYCCEQGVHSLRSLFANDPGRYETMSFRNLTYQMAP